MDVDSDLDVLRAVFGEASSVDPELRARARARLLATIAADAGNGSVRPSSAPGRRRAPISAVAAAIAVAVAAVFAAVVVPSLSRAPAATASASLLGLARAVGPEGWEGPGSGQFVYMRSTGERADCVGDACSLQGFERERWVALDGAGRIVETAGGRTSDETYGPGGLRFFDGQTWLGSDRGALRAEVADLTRQEDPTEFMMFVQIGRLMGETELLPELRTALFELAATFRGTVPLEAPFDALGRPAIGVGFESGAIRYEILFDGGSALVLEERVVAMRPGAEPIRVGGSAGDWLVPGSRTTYEVSGLVPSTTARIGG